MASLMLKATLGFAAVLLIASADVCSGIEASVPLQAHDSFFKPARPFTAMLVEYNKHNAGQIRKTKISLGSDGMRSESFGLGDDEEWKLVFLQDYHSDRRWLASPPRACYVELPKNKRVESTVDSSSDDEKSNSGVLARKPCNGYKSEKISTRAVKDTELSVWKCTDAQGHAYLQHFSTLLGIVIRQETQTGEVRELQEISLVRQSPDYFRPSNQWREVTLEEFFTGNPVLPVYEGQ